MNAAEEKYLLSLIPEEGITAPELGLLISTSSDPNVRRAKAWRKLPLPGASIALTKQAARSVSHDMRVPFVTKRMVHL